MVGSLPSGLRLRRLTSTFTRRVPQIGRHPTSNAISGAGEVSMPRRRLGAGGATSWCQARRGVGRPRPPRLKAPTVSETELRGLSRSTLDGRTETENFKTSRASPFRRRGEVTSRLNLERNWAKGEIPELEKQSKTQL